MVLRAAWRHSVGVPMIPDDDMFDTDTGKIPRSEWHHFISMALPFQRASAIRQEAVGGLTVVGLILGVLIVMRFLVAT